MIMFGCDPGFVPAGNTTAVCASDGRWIPDPATLVCTCKSTHSHLQYKKLWVGERAHKNGRLEYERVTM